MDGLAAEGIKDNEEENWGNCGLSSAYAAITERVLHRIRILRPYYLKPIRYLPGQSVSGHFRRASIVLSPLL